MSTCTETFPHPMILSPESALGVESKGETKGETKVFTVKICGISINAIEVILLQESGCFEVFVCDKRLFMWVYPDGLVCIYVGDFFTTPEMEIFMNQEISTHEEAAKLACTVWADTFWTKESQLTQDSVEILNEDLADFAYTPPLLKSDKSH